MKTHMILTHLNSVKLTLIQILMEQAFSNEFEKSVIKTNHEVQPVSHSSAALSSFLSDHLLQQKLTQNMTPTPASSKTGDLQETVR